MADIGNLDRYRVISALGAGGMATVDLAEDTVLGRRVALKQVSGDADVRGLSRLRREALVGASISHPNLVSVYDVVTTDDGHLIIVMEYVEGETLRQLLNRQGRLESPEALRILTGVAAGLDAINERGIVHRDVKPSNVLLGPGGAVKLADLGIASSPDRTRITTSGSILGSLSYMAPEQLSDAPVTPAIDVYALGAVAFEVLSGIKARREPNAVALAHAIATQGPPSLRDAWPRAPHGLDELLQRAMARDPRERPRTATELVARMRAVLEPEVTEEVTQRVAPPTPPPTPPPARAAGAVVPAAARSVPRPPRQLDQPVRRSVLASESRPRTVPPRRPPGPPPDDGSASPRRRRAAVAAGTLLSLAAVAVALVLLSSGGSPKPKRVAGGPGARSHRSASRTTSSTASTSRTSSSSSSSAAAASPSTGSSSSSSTTSPSQTTSASATSTAAAGIGGTGDPVSAVKSFYTLAAAHRYAQAWALADPTMQAQLGGYGSFQSGQAGDRSITFTSARTISRSASSARVSIATTSVRDNGTQHCTGTVDLVPAGSGQWQLHQIGINCR